MSLLLLQKITPRSRSKKQHPNRREMKSWTQIYFFFFFLSFSLPSFSFSETLARVIPLLSDYRRRHSSKSRFTPRLRRKEQRWSTEGRGKRGTKRHDCVPACASLMTVRKFQREWIIHGGKQKGVEVVSDRAMQRGVWIVTRVVHRPV